MLCDVQADDLILGGYPQTDGLVDELEHQEHGYRGIGGDGSYTHALHPQVVETAAVEQPAGGVEQAVRQGAPDAVGTVDRYSTHRVVHMELEVQQLHHQHHQDAIDCADEDRAQGVYRGTGGGDAHQASQRGVQTHGDVRLAAAHPGEDHAGEGGHGGGKGGVAQDLG